MLDDQDGRRHRPLWGLMQGGGRSRVLIVLVALTASSSRNDATQAEASRVMAVRFFPATRFKKVYLGAPDNAVIRLGPTFSIRAEGPRAILNRMVVAREGDIQGRRDAAEAEYADLTRLYDTLVITRNFESVKEWNSPHASRVKVYITMPRIESVDMASTGKMVVNGLHGQRFEAGVGRGQLILPFMKVEQAALSIGSGTVKARGRADKLYLDIRGSKAVDLRGLSVSSAVVKIGGSGSLRADVDGPVTVSGSGSGDVDLGRKARCRITKTGSGTVRCGG